MTYLPNSKSLWNLIHSKNISIDFLYSSLNNQHYFTEEFNFDNLLWKFNYNHINFFQLLQKSKQELLELRAVGDTTIDKLNTFLSLHNCEIGMFSDFSISNFNSILNLKISLDDLTESEKSISLILLNCLVKSTPNDGELGKEIRKIFNTIRK